MIKRYPPALPGEYHEEEGMGQPLWVVLGIWRLRSRSKAISLFWISVALSFCLLLSNTQWPSLRAILAILLLVSALWARAAIMWVDRKSEWIEGP